MIEFLLLSVTGVRSLIDRLHCTMSEKVSTGYLVLRKLTHRIDIDRDSVYQ